ncbi:type II secretion system F family protein [Psychrobium sp. 1_MG-2023]|uniref:type II secretion system F family protein n=1 Tax=Psychrobium sp. 1_MG-2023 TaxID=3062624 RepID=UPI000C33CE61|nr:type II secretion system F family protein [Psychrobium sp. 1_MG-2023]MDP2560861.1 type II secretion system F family protein [Psychrobium sp. 1_MG-2023]PKF56734.1 MSHA biogenesis protein MshG [Alteromonadales bacterium alter-6D02]
MPTFKYKSRDHQGQIIEGKLEANNATQVADILMGRGLIPIDVTQGEEEGQESIFSSLLVQNVSLDELVIFSRQMYSLMQAGIPVMRAIAGLRDSANNKKMVEALTKVLQDLESGRTFSSALAKQPRVFTKIVVSLVHVGENTGQLDEAFLQLAQYLEKEQETRKQIKAAMRYPTFVIFALVAAMVVLNLFVIPVFAQMFNKFGVELPWTTQALLATSSFFVNYWPVMLVASLGGFVWLKLWLASEQGELIWDQRKLRIPIVGSIIERALLARFGRSFSMMMGAGVPLLQGLSLVAEAVDNAYMAKKIVKMGSGIRGGESLLRVSGNSELFNPLVLQMIAVGEETGRLEQLMTSMAQYYEREVDFDLKSLTAKIEPILISIVAGMVLILALGIFTPMWDMMSAMKK